MNWGKVTITFDLSNEDEHDEFTAAIQGSDLALVVSRWFLEMRGHCKHGENLPGAEMARDKLREMMDDMNIEVM